MEGDSVFITDEELDEFLEWRAGAADRRNKVERVARAIHCSTQAAKEGPEVFWDAISEHLRTGYRRQAAMAMGEPWIKEDFSDKKYMD